MANVSFAGWEATITVGGATVAVAERIEWSITQELEEVRAIGDWKPQDLKEVFQQVRATLRRAYFKDATAADFFTKASRDANGYLTEFTMTVRYRDLSTGSPVDQTVTFSNCKVARHGNEVSAGRGVIVESIEVWARNASRA